MNVQEAVMELRNSAAEGDIDAYLICDEVADLIETMAADNQRKDEKIAALTAELEQVAAMCNKLVRTVSG